MLEITPDEYVELENDGERMIPDVHKDNLFYVEHMTRYTQSQPVVKGKVVLDIASGSGYGTKMLSEHAKKVIGVDISESAVKYARKNYGAKNIEYIVGDGESIPLKDHSVEVVTTFETIEHVPNYKKFLKEIKRVLTVDGVAVVSTPNDLEYGEGNHFHLYEFQHKELETLLKKHFKYVESYFQSTWRSVLLDKLDGHKTIDTRKIEVKNYSPLQDEEKTIYFYILCSDVPITVEIKPILGLGPHLSEATEWEAQKAKEQFITELKDANIKLQAEKDAAVNELHAIRNSKSFKLTRKIQKASRFTRTRNK